MREDDTVVSTISPVSGSIYVVVVVVVVVGSTIGRALLYTGRRTTTVRVGEAGRAASGPIGLTIGGRRKIGGRVPNRRKIVVVRDELELLERPLRLNIGLLVAQITSTRSKNSHFPQTSFIYEINCDILWRHTAYKMLIKF